MEYRNPFLATLAVEFVRVIKRDVPPGKPLVDGDYYDVETVEATRVLRDKEMMNIVMQLPAPALKLYMYLIYNIQDGAVTVKLDDLKLMQLFDCTDRTVLRMRQALVSAAILAKMKQNVYWVNPRFFASKSRLKLYSAHTVQVALVREKY